jgi:hypothetical protein
MTTAVQLRPIGPLPLPRCDLVYGTPREVLDGALGRIALFDPGALVAYRLRCERRSRLFVFRTLSTVRRAATVVPGVRPGVQLLLELRSAGRVRLAAKLFAHLEKRGRSAADLPDGFYIRVGAALGGRLPAQKILLSLLPAAGEANVLRSHGSAAPR